MVKQNKTVIKNANKIWLIKLVFSLLLIALFDKLSLDFSRIGGLVSIFSLSSLFLFLKFLAGIYALYLIVWMIVKKVKGAKK